MPIDTSALAQLKAKYKTDRKALKTGTAATSSGGGVPTNAGLGGVVGADGQIDIAALLAQIQGQYDTANTRNEARLSEIKNLYGATYDAAEKDLEGLGATRTQEIKQQEAQDLGGIDANAVSRGIYGLTTLDALKNQRKTETQKSLNDLGERISTTRSGLRERRAQGLAGVIERVSDEGPDTGALYGLIGQASAQRSEATARKEAAAERKLELDDLQKRYDEILKKQSRTGYWSFGSWLPGGRQWIDTSAPGVNA